MFIKSIISTAILAYHADAFSSRDASRRAFLSNVKSTASLIVPTVATTTINPTISNAIGVKELVNDLEASKAKMLVIPELLEANEWDKVRTILKTPPVNSLWNLGESKNTLVQLAKATGEIELLELKDDLAINLQMCDQLTYDNAFVYFQPGNGKVNIKEPTSLAKKAMGQISEAISLASQ